MSKWSVTDVVLSNQIEDCSNFGLNSLKLFLVNATFLFLVIILVHEQKGIFFQRGNFNY